MLARHARLAFIAVLLLAATSAVPAWPAAVVVEATASHDLPTKYAVSKAIDGDAQTHWAANSSLPQWIHLRLAEPAQIDTLNILGVSQQRIYDTWRRVSVSFSDGSAFTLTLADTGKWHILTFPKRKTNWVKVTIESTYKRTHYLGCEEIQISCTGHGSSTVNVEPKPEARRPTVAPASSEWEPNEADRRLLSRLAPAHEERPANPNLWVNADDVERGKRHIRAKRWAFDWFRSTLRQADEWAAKSDDDVRGLVPTPYAAFDRTAICPSCGKRLSAGFAHPFKASCHKCDVIFPNEDYPDDGTGWKNPKTGKMHYFVGCYNEAAIFGFDRALRALADAYAVTRAEKFAVKVSLIFDALAVIYPTCDKGPKWYPGIGGRLNRPFYQTARAMIGYADQYDLTFHSPEWERPSANPKHKTRRDNFEANFLRNGGEYCYTRILKAGIKSLNNGYCDYLQGAVAVGRVLGVQRYLDYALESNMSILNFIENTIDRDGQYFETAFMYSSHAIELFSHHAEMLRYYRSPKYRNGINLYDHPKLKLAFLRSESDVDCAGHVPPLGDTGPDLRVIPAGSGKRVNWYVYRRLEYLAARAGKPQERLRYARQLCAYVSDLDEARGRSTMRRWLVFNAAGDPQAPQPPPSAETANTLLPGSRGVGILRSGTPLSGEAAALLRWGPTLNHGSPDELNLNFFALGREITLDPGYLWAHLRAGWTHATGSHNLVVVNEANQLQRPGSGGDLELWFQAPGVSAMSANDPMCYGKEGVSRYRRTLVLADISPSRHYLLDVFRVHGGHTHDLNWHFVGNMERSHGIELPPPEASGSLAGPEYEWWKFMQPNGWLKGVDKGFYWAAPPGNGYGFIHRLRRTAAPKRCSFDWKVGERAPMPKWTFEPANHVGESSRKGHKPLSVGSLFYRGQEPGDFIEFDLPVNKPGDYLLLAVFYKSPHYGIVQPSLDGEKLGKPVNTFSPTGYFSDPIVLGRRHLTRDRHRLRLTVAGQDDESQGHYFSVKYFALDTPDFLDRAHVRTPEMVRLTLLPPTGAGIIVGQSKEAGPWPGATYVITRLKDERHGGRAEVLSTQFVSVVEPIIGQPQVTSVNRLLPSTAVNAEDVAALRISTHGGRVDYVFEAVEPAEAATYVHGNSERVRFGGRFGVARTSGNKIVQLSLSGNGELEGGDKRLRVTDAEWQGQVKQVEIDNCTVQTDETLPTDGSLDRCVIQFTNPAYSRRAPFVIKRVAAVEGGSRIELDTASLVMAQGLVGDMKVPLGTIANTVPLDRERMVRRGFATLYFRGKRLLSDVGAGWGNVKSINVSNWHVVSTDSVRPKPGQRFSIVEIAPGDTFTIIRNTTVAF